MSQQLGKFGHHPDAVIDAEVECERLAGLLAEAHAGLLRALDFRAATPEGLAIKADVRDALRRTGFQGNFGTQQSYSGVAARGEPDPKCPACHGHGRREDPDEGQYVVCSCSSRVTA